MLGAKRRAMVSAQSKLALTLLFAGVPLIQLAMGAQLNVGIESDMSKPTMGLHGQSSSQVTYNDREGLNMNGAINDLLGPPIKIAKGVGQMFAGSNMAGLGSSLKADGAVLGFDAKLLEAAGGANLLKGGLLLGGSAAKTGAATVMKGLPGKKIASIIELPVKVVALKDLAAGKTLMGAGKLKGAEALAAKEKGDHLLREGETLKQQGLSQVLQGATEGMQNLGNMMTRISADANTSIKLLPIMLDLPMQGQQQQQQQEVKGQQEVVKGQQEVAKGQQEVVKGQQYENNKGRQQYDNHGLSGGSLFGGLGSLIPGLAGGADLFGLGGGGGAQGNHNAGGGLAAVLNANNPITSLLMNPAANPFLLPMNGGPFSQALSGKQAGTIVSPLGGLGQLIAGGLTGGLGNLNHGQPSQLAEGAQPPYGQSFSNSFNILPGIKFSEHASMSLPTKGGHQQQQQQQVQDVQKS